jgi:hypothetical protein
VGVDYEEIVKRSLSANETRRTEEQAGLLLGDLESDTAHIIKRIPGVNDELAEKTVPILCRLIRSGILTADILRSVLGSPEQHATGEDEREVSDLLFIDKVGGESSELKKEIVMSLVAFAKRIEAVLMAWEGQRPKTLERKRSLVASAQTLVSLVQHAFVCQTCGKPARLRAAQSPAHEDGVFQFVHTKGKKTTHHAGPEVPQLKLVFELRRGSEDPSEE